jgi:hypothetical protein
MSSIKDPTEQFVKAAKVQLGAAVAAADDALAKYAEVVSHVKEVIEHSKSRKPETARIMVSAAKDQLRGILGEACQRLIVAGREKDALKLLMEATKEDECEPQQGES